jgi:hypothetical protein
MGLGAKMDVTDWPERGKWLCGWFQLVDLMAFSAQKKAASRNLISGFDFIWLPDPGSNQGPID